MVKSKTKKEVSLDDLCLKRDEALERVVEIFLKCYDEEEEELNIPHASAS